MIAEIWNMSEEQNVQISEIKKQETFRELHKVNVEIIRQCITN